VESIVESVESARLYAPLDGELGQIGNIAKNIPGATTNNPGEFSIVSPMVVEMLCNW